MSLHEILEYSLNNDPSILEAKENEIAAGHQVKSSQALNYPVVSVSANRSIFEKNRFKDKKNKKFEPALNTTLNIFSWGKISSTIKKDKEQEQYFHQEFFNKQEELGYQIAKLYIESIRSVEAIKAYEKNIQRHRKIVGELEIITSHDKGRQSELVEANTKLLSIETNIRKEIKNLDLTLSQISKYINKEINEQDLEYPFSYSSAKKLINQYADIDIQTNPLYLLQEAELKRQKHDVESMLTNKLPNINLQSTITKDDKIVFLNMNWNILDEVTRNSSKKGLAQVNAAYERLNQTTRDLQQQINSSVADMRANEAVIKKSTEHLKSQEKVIESYELQYKIARRSLTDLLNAYSEISNIEMMKINSEKEYFDAILNYLKANAKIYEWFVGQDNKPISAKLDTQNQFVSHKTKSDHLKAGEDLTAPTTITKQALAHVQTDNQQNSEAVQVVNNQLDEEIVTKEIETSTKADDLIIPGKGRSLIQFSAPLVKAKTSQSIQAAGNESEPESTIESAEPVQEPDTAPLVLEQESTIEPPELEQEYSTKPADELEQPSIEDVTDEAIIDETIAEETVIDEATAVQKIKNLNLIKRTPNTHDEGV